MHTQQNQKEPKPGEVVFGLMRAVKKTALDRDAKNVLRVLALHASRSSFAFPSIGELMDHTAMPRATLYRHLESLLAGKHIHRETQMTPYGIRQGWVVHPVQDPNWKSKKKPAKSVLLKISPMSLMSQAGEPTSGPSSNLPVPSMGNESLAHGIQAVPPMGHITAIVNSQENNQYSTVPATGVAVIDSKPEKIEEVDPLGKSKKKDSGPVNEQRSPLEVWNLWRTWMLEFHGVSLEQFNAPLFGKVAALNHHFSKRTARHLWWAVRNWPEWRAYLQSFHGVPYEMTPEKPDLGCAWYHRFALETWVQNLNDLQKWNEQKEAA